MTLGTVILRDLLANRPAASIEGRLFFPTDVGAVYAYRDSGTAWQQINIQGPTGAAGSAGAAGAAATISVGSTATGSAGSSAIVSNSGTSSAAVLDFVVPQGAAGSAGSAGAAGADGKTLRNGTGTPSSGLGVDGDFYIDTTAEAIYGPKTSGSWGSSTSLVGPTGSSGGSGVVTATTPLAYNSGTQTVSIQQASGSQSGYLGSADWTTFNGKQSALGFTPENSANKGAASGYCGLDGSTLVLPANLPVFGASGTGHAKGAVPDPGSTAATTHFLCEDGSWSIPPGTAGGIPAAITSGPDWPPTSPSTYDDEFVSSGLGVAWTWNNQGSATANVSNSNLVLTVPAATGDNQRGVFRSLPSGNWTFVGKVYINTFWSNFILAGMAITDGTKLQTIGMGFNSDNWMGVFQQATVTSGFGSGVGTKVFVTGACSILAYVYYQIAYDGTNLKFSYSLSGAAGSFFQVYSQTATSYLSSLASIGFTAQSNNATYAVILCADFLRRTA